HAPGVVLQVEGRRRIRMTVPELAPHFDDIRGERDGIAWHANDRLALRFERRADRGVAGDEARPGQRLMLPRPRTFALITPERGERGDRETGSAVGTQPH